MAAESLKVIVGHFTERMLCLLMHALFQLTFEAVTVTVCHFTVCILILFMQAPFRGVKSCKHMLCRYTGCLLGHILYHF